MCLGYVGCSKWADLGVLDVSGDVYYSNVWYASCVQLCPVAESILKSFELTLKPFETS